MHLSYFSNIFFSGLDGELHLLLNGQVDSGFVLDGPGVGGGHGDGGLDGCPFLFLLLMLLIWLDRGRSWLGGADAPPPVAVLDGDDEADGASLFSFSAFSNFFSSFSGCSEVGLVPPDSGLGAGFRLQPRSGAGCGRGRGPPLLLGGLAGGG